MCNNIKGVDNIHNNEKKCNHAHKYNSNNIIESIIISVFKRGD